jgi:Galactose oxidase-like, Early set domain
MRLEQRRTAELPTPGVDNRELRIEIYEPSYYSAARPGIASAPGSTDYGQPFDVHTAEAAHISRVSLVRAGSVTHAFNPDQRYVGIRFARMGGDRLQCLAPPNANVAPPGYYLLFVIDDLQGDLASPRRARPTGLARDTTFSSQGPLHQVRLMFERTNAIRDRVPGVVHARAS